MPREQLVSASLLCLNHSIKPFALQTIVIIKILTSSIHQRVFIQFPSTLRFIFRMAVREVFLLLLLSTWPLISVRSTPVDNTQFQQTAQASGTAQCVKIAFDKNGQMFCGQKWGTVVVYPDSNSGGAATEVWSARDITYSWADR